jgi:hypothetical protein
VKKHLESYGSIYISPSGDEVERPWVFRTFDKARKVAKFWGGYVLEIQ